MYLWILGTSLIGIEESCEAENILIGLNLSRRSILQFFFKTQGFLVVIQG